MLAYAGVCTRMHTYAHVCTRMLTGQHALMRYGGSAQQKHVGVKLKQAQLQSTALKQKNAAAGVAAALKSKHGHQNSARKTKKMKDKKICRRGGAGEEHGHQYSKREPLQL